MKHSRGIDTAPHPDFPVYASGNFAEVAPARWSVMSWSLIGDPVERGLRAFTLRLCPSARWATGSNYVFVGYFCCRPYHNLSGLCQLARELPGVSEQDVTEAYFEGASPPERDTRAHSSAAQRLLALPRMAREFHRLRPRLACLEAQVALCEEHVSTALASGSEIALGCAVADALEVLDEAWEVHYMTTCALIPAGALQRALGERLLSHWSELAPLVTRPTDVVWGRLFDGAIGASALEACRFLGFPFYEVGDAHEPWKSFAAPFAPHSPAQVPGPRPDDAPEVVWEMYRGAPVRALEHISRAVVDTLKAREESKALAMRCLHVFRRALPALAEEAGVGTDAWTYLRILELLSPRLRSTIRELSERRRQECHDALSQPLPERLVTAPRAPAPTQVKQVGAGVRRSPSGVSPGVVRGVVARLADEALAGRSHRNGTVILVCGSADAGIQALLPKIGGLVTLRGSMLSHIATLAREYGIPAVVNHPLAETLRTGQYVSVNGSTGEVEVIS
jgi:phosphohistidine swiveling domain-containing protein